MEVQENNTVMVKESPLANILRSRVLKVIDEHNSSPKYKRWIKNSPKTLYGYVARRIENRREFGNLNRQDAEALVVALCFHPEADIPESADLKNMVRGMIDSDPMPWGAHAGTPIGEVPFDYLLKYYRKMWLDDDVRKYFENQLRELEANEIEMCQVSGKKPKKYLIDNYEFSYPY